MKYKHCLSLLLVTLATGCATVDTVYVPEEQSFSRPPLNTVTTVGLGETMVSQGRLVEHDAIHFEAEFRWSGAYTMLPGYWAKEGEDKGGNFYVPSPHGSPGSIRKNPFVDPWRAIYIPFDNSKTCVVTVFSLKACHEYEGEWQHQKQAGISDKYFQQYLVYGGGYENKINMVYREILYSRARPAFDHNVEYDLSESSVVGYRGARLEIIKATNSEITYKVLSNFDPAR